MRRVFLWLMLLTAPLGYSHAAERVFRLDEIGEIHGASLWGTLCVSR